MKSNPEDADIEALVKKMNMYIRDNAFLEAQYELEKRRRELAESRLKDLTEVEFLLLKEKVRG